MCYTQYTWIVFTFLPLWKNYLINFYCYECTSNYNLVVISQSIWKVFQCTLNFKIKTEIYGKTFGTDLPWSRWMIYVFIVKPRLHLKIFYHLIFIATSWFYYTSVRVLLFGEAMHFAEILQINWIRSYLTYTNHIFKRFFFLTA